MLSAELYKIVKRRSVWITFFLIMTYVFITTIRIFFPDSYLNLAKTESGELLRGREGLEYNQEFARNLKGVLDETLVQRVMSVYRDEEFLSRSGVDEYENAFFFNAHFLKSYSVEKAFPNINFDLTYGYFDSWKELFRTHISIVKLFVIVVILIGAPLFSYECSCSINGLLLSAKNGRRKCSIAKVKASFLLTNMGWFCVILLHSAMYLSHYGMEGYDTSVQINSLESMQYFTYPLNNLQMYLCILLVDFLAINVILLISLFISLKNSSPFQSMCITLVVLYIIRSDMVFTHIKHPIIERMVTMLPINMLDNYWVFSHYPSVNLFRFSIPFGFFTMWVYGLFLSIGFGFFFKYLGKNQIYFAK